MKLVIDNYFWKINFFRKDQLQKEKSNRNTVASYPKLTTGTATQDVKKAPSWQ